MRPFPLVLALLAVFPSVLRAEQDDPFASATGRLADAKVMACATDAGVVAVTYEMGKRPGWVIVEGPGAGGWQSDQAGSDGGNIWFTDGSRYLILTEADDNRAAVFTGVIDGVAMTGTCASLDR